MLELKGITKKFGDLTVFSGFDLSVADGETLAVMGDSGSGKTTLLNIIAGLIPFEGSIEGLPPKIGYIFQNDRLVPHMTVLENLTLVAPEERAAAYLEKAGLGEFASAYPSRLSAGMSRRVAILRAFLYGAPLLLMDEPFRNLDLSLKFRMMDFFAKLRDEEKSTVLLVTHDAREAEVLADRVVLLRKGGEIVFDESNVTQERIEREFLSR